MRIDPEAEMRAILEPSHEELGRIVAGMGFSPDAPLTRSASKYSYTFRSLTVNTLDMSRCM